MIFPSFTNPTPTTTTPTTTTAATPLRHRHSQMHVLYASQTGNAEAIANSITKQLVELGFAADCQACNDYEKLAWSKGVSVIVVGSTTGEGEPPDNAIKFFKWLRKLPFESLKNVNFTLLGLGDTNYTYFCNFGKKVVKFMKLAGAWEFYPSGFADDAVGLELVVEPWMEKLWPSIETVCKHRNASSPVQIPLESAEIRRSATPEPTKTNALGKFINPSRSISPVIEIAQLLAGPSPSKVEEEVSLSPTLHQFPLDWGDFEPDMPLTAVPKLFPASIKLETLTPTTEGKVVFNTSQEITMAQLSRVTCLTSKDALKRTLMFDFTVSGVDWVGQLVPGDSFGIFTSNPRQLAQATFERLGWNDEFLDSPVILSPLTQQQLPSHLQPASKQPTRLREVLMNLVDLTGGPLLRKPLLRLLAEHCSDPLQRKKLLFICSKQGLKTFNTLREVLRPSLLDLLTLFPSCDAPPVELLLEALPAMQPRYYSCLNKPHPSQLQCIMNVVEFDDFQGRKRWGLCSGHLDRITGSLREGSSRITNLLIPIIPRRIDTPFKFTTTPSLPAPAAPVILIAAGTGIAPFMSFLRSWPRHDQVWLLFGCRHPDKDHLFREELEDYAKKTGLLLSVCFSQDDQGEKNYVTDELKRQKEHLCQLLLANNARIYLCGDAKGLARSVDQTLSEIIEAWQGCTNKEAVQWLMNLHRQGRYLKEIWS